MGKRQKIEIIDLDLGKEISIDNDIIEPKTIAKIDEKINIALSEKEIISKNYIPTNLIEECYTLLTSRIESKEPTKLTELCKIASSDKSSFVMSQLGKIIKQRNIWKIIRKKQNNETIYYLEPKDQEA
jgi:hypothetical protein